MNIYFLSQIAQIVLGILVVILVMIQSKGKGLASSVGGNIGFYKSRRGLEKLIFIATVFVGLLFVLNSIILVIYS